MADDWRRAEVEAIVSDYFDMLRKELTGEPYSKTAHRHALAARLDARSNGSIEFKHANISAVLVGLGLPYVDGYKPRGNYQQLLEKGVLEYFRANPDFFPRFVDSAVVNPHEPPNSNRPFSMLLEQPPDRLEAGPRVWMPNGRGVNVDFVRHDAENRRLGRLGEEFVLELERRRLHEEASRPELAKRVEWVSAMEGGDGAGYDIASFNEDGSPRYIEVKTTGSARRFRSMSPRTRFGVRKRFLPLSICTGCSDSRAVPNCSFSQAHCRQHVRSNPSSFWRDSSKPSMLPIPNVSVFPESRLDRDSRCKYA